MFPLELSVGEARANGQRMFTEFVRDLTSRQKMEHELRQSQKMEAVGQLTGGVAHDFNNLLTVITANLEMLTPCSPIRPTGARERGLGRRSRWREACRPTPRLRRRQPLNPKPTDIGRHLHFADLLRRTVGEAIELRIHVGGSAHLTVVDSSQLHNAMLNLAINARDAMPRGGKLTVEVTHVRLDADYARIPRYPYRALRPHHGHRHRNRDVRRGAPEGVRAVLHHQTDRRRHRARPQHGLRLRQAVRRKHPDLQRARRGTSVRISCLLPRASGRRDANGGRSAGMIYRGIGNDPPGRGRPAPAPRPWQAAQEPRLRHHRGRQWRRRLASRRATGNRAGLHRHGDAGGHDRPDLAQAAWP